MSSFYGGNGGVTSKVVNSLISDSSQKAKRHIVASESEPFGQQVGDLWLVLEKDENENKTRVDLTYNSAEGIFEGQIETGIMTAAQLEAGYDFYGEIDGKEVSFMVAEITDQPDCTLIKLFSPMVEGIVECGYYYKTGRITKRLRAILDDGLIVNNKLKVLSGAISSQDYDRYIKNQSSLLDDNVQRIEIINNLFENFNPTEMNIISSSKSDIPIYAKWDDVNKIINIYLEANKLQCNINSRFLFNGFRVLSESSILDILEQIDNFNNVENIKHMFSYTKITTIPNIIKNSSHLKEIAHVFDGCDFLTDISLLSDININQITSLEAIFKRNTSLTDISSLENWNINQITNLRYTFSWCTSLIDISPLENWDVSNVTDMFGLFSGNAGQEVMKISNISPLENWDVSNVTNLSNMFLYNISLSDISPLRNWDVSNVTNLDNMFAYCSSLSDISPLRNWDISNVTILGGMFSSCSTLSDISPLENWDVSNVTDMSGLFASCSISDISLLENWDVSNVTNLGSMFANCSSLLDISPLENWDVSNVTNMFYLFANCSSLSDISFLEKWDVSNVTNLGRMFEQCNLTTVSLPNWNIKKVTASVSYNSYGLGKMFANCSNLEQVYLTNWDFSNVKQMTSMFRNTPKLQHVYVSQASYDSFLRAVDNGCNITNMWTGSNISQFTIIDS